RPRARQPGWQRGPRLADRIQDRAGRRGRPVSRALDPARGRWARPLDRDAAGLAAPAPAARPGHDPRAEPRVVKLAMLGNASVIHTRRWAEYFRARDHDVRVWSLEPPLPGFEATPLPRAPLPGFLRYPLATPAL